ncbi:hypothetical protein [Vibrio sp. SCSIO 43136]|uniref:hypothetical protein n=1 Tax=Vibrio sp. SCSIO 43136 TaxID=2819101 RepID=UPI002075C589|nr:hypothetical protein [Vibrio sp. SCSIO 43136]USD64269.1 BatD family protein [Vibrio sp. SCSIO 43136]
MNNTGLKHILLFALAGLFSLMAYAQPMTLADMKENGEFELVAWIDESQQNTHVRQQTILNIEVATTQWFTGGTQIGHVDIPNVFVKQLSPLATNYTERKHGKTWSRQRWEVALYPMASGDYLVPPLPVSVQVAASDRSKVAGVVYTPPMRFTAGLASAHLSHDGDWFIATQASLKQRVEQSSSELKVGDSITRTITLEAHNSFSPLLPDLMPFGANQAYQVYPQPKIRQDHVRRTTNVSTLEESQVYVLQQGGSITFPAIELVWWNSDIQQLETLVVEEYTIEVSHTLSSWLAAHKLALISLVAAMTLIIMLWLGTNRYLKNHPTPEIALLLTSLHNQQWAIALRLIYKRLRHQQAQLELVDSSRSEADRERAERIQNHPSSPLPYLACWLKITKVWRGAKGVVLPKAIPQLATIKTSKDLKQ